ncbi:MAG: hypothetical protein KTR29_16325, partial [Rhodothermaceae bacterium]|nr:hypothetical protein [Rhodothermaceae bacterium]
MEHIFLRLIGLSRKHGAYLSSPHRSIREAWNISFFASQVYPGSLEYISLRLTGLSRKPGIYLS